ncbi:MAG: Bacterial antitoxin of ParD toxin-antitoxin type system [Candidatus Parcubacteria bacterium]|jgi:putative addiction module CopG family antidote
MSILSVSLTPELEKFIEDEIASGEFESKGQLVKKALKKFEEDLIIQRILKAGEEAEAGMVLRGNLDDLVKLVK